MPLSRFRFEILHSRFLLGLRFPKVQERILIVFLEPLALRSQVSPAPHQFATNRFPLGESGYEVFHQFLVLLEFQ